MQPLATGFILNNRYRIVKLIGEGGGGAVYRAWDLTLKQPVAIKENKETSPASIRQFETEAMLLAGLRHPNLPRVIDHFFVSDLGQYLVMDFIDGENLGELLQANGVFTVAEVMPWLRQICSALDYLHSRTPPVIHRDIKPTNIKITPEGEAFLVDFGISKQLDPTQMTTKGAKGVTPGFSPPEQYGGRGPTEARSDIYALGATLYMLLTGEVPPDAMDLILGREVVTPPDQLNRSIPGRVSQLIQASLNSQP